MVSVLVPALAVLLAVRVSVLYSGRGVGREACSDPVGQTGHGKVHIAVKSILGDHVDRRWCPTFPGLDSNCPDWRA